MAGPIAGVLADALGWREFFIFTLVTGVPGMILLQRFAPWGVRDPEFGVATPGGGPPLTGAAIAARAAGVGLLAWAGSVLSLALAGAAKASRAGQSFDLLPTVGAILGPRSLGDWTTAIGLLVIGVLSTLGAAAALAARARKPTSR
jgi:PAT family beta-lactamase induction signal transducer AmpG